MLFPYSGPSFRYYCHAPFQMRMRYSIFYSTKVQETIHVTHTQYEGNNNILRDLIHYIERLNCGLSFDYVLATETSN